MKLALLFILVINGLILSTDCIAEKIIVGLEPFPPYIKQDGSGYTVDMLKAIEKISDFQFEIKIMTYARAKSQLKYNHIDMLGHTPKALETVEFYQYGEDLDWQINTSSDLFVLDRNYLTLNNIKPKRIGTTLGNASFFSEQVGIPTDYFIEVGTLNQLISMLMSRRIDVLLFERVSIMSLLQDFRFQEVFYQSIGKVPASIAVANTVKGKELKQKIDQLIKQLDLTEIFPDYLTFSQLPDSGPVPIF